jgi:glucokinase
MDSRRVIGVDVGGTKILAAVVDRSGVLLRQDERPTPTGSQDELVGAIESAVREVFDEGMTAIGLGVPSQIDQATGIAYGSVNIPLHELRLRELMSERFGIPTEIENDANAAAFAEWTLGAGRGTNTMVMLTLGTGVGGGVVIDRRLYRGWAEFGHIVVEYDGKPCQGTCTGRGHIESYCTGVAAGEDAAKVFGAGTDAHALVSLAEQGDQRAIEVLARIGRYLGAGIGSLVNIFNPELVVLGGGFGAAAWQFLLGPAREIVRREALAPADEELRIVPAELGAAAGVIGAGLVAFEALDEAE